MCQWIGGGDDKILIIIIYMKTMILLLCSFIHFDNSPLIIRWYSYILNEHLHYTLQLQLLILILCVGGFISIMISHTGTSIV